MCYYQGMLVKLISIARYAIGGGGLYLALSQLHSNLPHAVALASLTAVGFVGTLSFVSHVFLHEGDAKRIGFSAKTPSFQFEVGFANLAFGLTAIISYYADWGLRANTALLLAYAIYLFQAGVLHAYTGRASKKTRQANLIRAGLTFIFCGAMLYVVLEAVTSVAF